MKGVEIGGTYRHFKNKKLYKVVGIAKHSETLEEMVVYEPQYESQSKLWVRPLSMFGGEVEVDGIKQKRFELI